MRIDNYLRHLLLEIMDRELEHRQTKRPQGIGRAAGAEKFAWGQVETYGPRVCNLLSGPVDDTDRKRISRALQRLAAAGLVELGRVHGVNVTNVKLTRKGRELTGSTEHSGT